MSAIITSATPTQALPYRVWDAWKNHPDRRFDRSAQVYQLWMDLEDDGFAVQVAGHFEREDDYPVTVMHVWMDDALAYDLAGVLDPSVVIELSNKWAQAHAEMWEGV